MALLKIVGERMKNCGCGEIYDKNVLGIIGGFLMEEEKMVRKRKGWMVRELLSIQCAHRSRLRPSKIKFKQFLAQYWSRRAVMREIDGRENVMELDLQVSWRIKFIAKSLGVW